MQTSEISRQTGWESLTGITAHHHCPVLPLKVVYCVQIFILLQSVA
jgi:hypothetical protein